MQLTNEKKTTSLLYTHTHPLPHPHLKNPPKVTKKIAQRSQNLPNQRPLPTKKSPLRNTIHPAHNITKRKEKLKHKLTSTKSGKNQTPAYKSRGKKQEMDSYRIKVSKERRRGARGGEARIDEAEMGGSIAGRGSREE
jgi:hypothetical protein